MSWRLIEFECPTHGRFEELLPRSESAASSHRCPSCNADAERVLSASKVGTVWGYAASRGSSNEAHPNPAVLNTRGLADGMKESEWRKQRHEFRRQESIAEARRKFG